MEGRILVVDDEEHIRHTVAVFLKQSGFQVDEADGFESAVTLMQSQKYDVVVTDKNMPYSDDDNESGMLLLEYTKKYHQTAQVLLMTGYPSFETAIDSIKLGAFDYLLKPFPMESLKEKVERILEYQSYLRPEDAIQTYKAFFGEILDLIAHREVMTLEDLHTASKSITDKIDGLVRIQQRWAKSDLLHRKALDKITTYTEQLMDHISKDGPAHRLVGKIREESQRLP